jgi:hypothetical protein
MQLLGGPALIYQPGQTLFEPPGSVHLYAENLSLTEPAKILLTHVADDGALLVVFSLMGGAARETSFAAFASGSDWYQIAIGCGRQFYTNT